MPGKFGNKKYNNDDLLYYMIYMIYSNTAKVIFCDVIGCYIWVYNFILLKSSINPSHPNPERREKIKLIFISIQLSEMHPREGLK